MSIYVYIYIPGTCLSSILGLEPSKGRPFPIKVGSFGFQVYIIYDIHIYIWFKIVGPQKECGRSKPFDPCICTAVTNVRFEIQNFIFFLYNHFGYVRLLSFRKPPFHDSFDLKIQFFSCGQQALYIPHFPPWKSIFWRTAMSMVLSKWILTSI